MSPLALASLLALAGLGAAVPSRAAEPASDKAAAPTLIEPVTVTGARASEPGASVLGERIAPASAPVDLHSIPASTLAEPGRRDSLAALLATDASLGENYATTGYYQNFTIRGLTLDLGSAYRINGFVVPAEFGLPLDNAADVQILAGIGALHGGMVGAGGTINVVTRRAAGANIARVELEPRGGRLVSVDAALPVPADAAWSARVDATHADLRPAQPDADGHRDLLSLALDAHPAASVALAADVIAQRQRQPAVPGFQLLGGLALPDLAAVRDVNINRQPWSRPVENHGVMADVRMQWQASPSLWVEAGIARTVVLIDDNLATPTGCNSAPVQYFCSNGDYVLYDYHASERRTGDHALATLHAIGRTGDVAHVMTAGIERIARSIAQNDLYSATSYDADGNALTGNLRSTDQPLPAPPGVGADQPRRRAAQTSGFVADRLTAGEIDVFAALRVTEIDQQPEAVRARRVLPQLAATWHFASTQMLYASATQGLEFGSAAPLIASNAGALLAPRRARQLEAGWKGRSGDAHTQWTVAAFTLRRPDEYTEPVGSSFAGLGDYVQRGVQTHEGFSASGETMPSRVARLEGSFAFLGARASGTGVPAYDGVQIQNVPRYASFVRATWLPLPSLDLSIAWTERGWRNARRDGAATVPGYALFDLGAAWHASIGGRPLAVAASVRNLADRRYWRDVGEAYSADLLFPGAGRSATLAMRLDF